MLSHLRRWTTPGTGASKVDRPALRGHRRGGQDPWRGGPEQHGQRHSLGVEGGPRAALLDHALERPVVSVVGGVPDGEVVGASGRQPLHPVASVQAGRLYGRVVAALPVVPDPVQGDGLGGRHGGEAALQHHLGSRRSRRRRGRKQGRTRTKTRMRTRTKRRKRRKSKWKTKKGVRTRTRM